MMGWNRYRKSAIVNILESWLDDIAGIMVKIWLSRNATSDDSQIHATYYEELPQIECHNLIDMVGEKPPRKSIIEYGFRDYRDSVNDWVIYYLSEDPEWRDCDKYDTSKVNVERITKDVGEYLDWLSDGLSKYGYVKRHDIHDKLSELGYTKD